MGDPPGELGVDYGFGSLQIKRASTAEQVAEALRQMILRGEVEQGQPLREVALAASIGVSRNTMREAIRVLAREGIVTHHMHRGAVVTRLDARDVRDIFRVRRVLEHAALQATLGAEPEQLAGLADAVHALELAAQASDWGGIIDADELFHERLVDLLGSRRLSRFFDAIQAEIRLCMSIVDRSTSDTDVLVAEHRELLRLITGRELGRCAEVMGGHLADAEEMLTLLVADGSELPADGPPHVRE
jgi:DNA-binding GntR family transcriptional regulator